MEGSGILSDGALGALSLRIGNPVALVVSCEDKLFLAVAQVNNVTLASSLVPSISLDMLVDSSARIQKGANDARSDDLGRLTGCMGNWLNQDRDAPEVKVFDHTPSIMVPGVEERFGRMVTKRGWSCRKPNWDTGGVVGAAVF
ncbi:hypothetical protein B0H10DRAFT_1966262 [Mycena sp. CBHHK59/15]|nr:hypothetical protein B0H10DRAFT_1966262 [Mycena sp. CBHHK59/15]